MNLPAVQSAPYLRHQTRGSTKGSYWRRQQCEEGGKGEGMGRWHGVEDHTAASTTHHEPTITDENTNRFYLLPERKK